MQTGSRTIFVGLALAAILAAPARGADQSEDDSETDADFTTGDDFKQDCATGNGWIIEEPNAGQNGKLSCHYGDGFGVTCEVDRDTDVVVDESCEEWRSSEKPLRPPRPSIGGAKKLEPSPKEPSAPLRRPTLSPTAASPEGAAPPTRIQDHRRPTRAAPAAEKPRPPAPGPGYVWVDDHWERKKAH